MFVVLQYHPHMLHDRRFAAWTISHIRHVYVPAARPKKPSNTSGDDD
jgi:hypothetical protein